MIEFAYLAKVILEHCEDYEWSLQGLGMLRLYLAPEVRLHVWDSRYVVSGVSQMHTHPWHFHSTVLAGSVTNHRYEETGFAGSRVCRQRIRCGEGGGLVGEPEIIELTRVSEEHYKPGDCYHQLASEIHVSEPESGTVTIIRRDFQDDSDHAHVFWPEGAEWVSAEPRRAAEEEVRDICGASLKRWFS